MNRPAIVGHRGVRGVLPENTLVAIAEAKRQGADAVEIDVRPTRDGALLVFHDPDLLRLTGDPRRIADTTASAISQARIEGEPIPRLSDVLDLCASLGLGLNVEIKHDIPDKVATVRAASKLLRAARGVDLVVSSFDPWILTLSKAMLSEVCHAQLIHASNYHELALWVARAPHIDGVHLEHGLATPRRMAPFLGQRFINVWTVNDHEEATRTAYLGAEAIITDRPASVRSVFDP